jgi:hypothetical protein
MEERKARATASAKATATATVSAKASATATAGSSLRSEWKLKEVGIEGKRWVKDG